MSKLKEQAAALHEAAASCIIHSGKDLTLEEFTKWVEGTVNYFSHDEEWQECVDELDIDMSFIQDNLEEVYQEVIKVM